MVPKTHSADEVLLGWGRAGGMTCTDSGRFNSRSTGAWPVGANSFSLSWTKEYALVPEAGLGGCAIGPDEVL